MGRFVIIFLFFTKKLTAATLWAIIVCDTSAPYIERACEKDLKHVQRQVHSIAKYTKLALNETLLQGRDLTAKALYEQLERVNPTSNDTIFFFFSGHGYRLEGKISPWPNLAFSQADQGMGFEKVIEILQQKQVRLVIAIADCCNNIIPDDFAPDLKRGFIEKGKSNRKKDHYHSLFVDARGLVAIASSKAGQYSWCSSRGAIFTSALLKEIELKTKMSKNVTWESLFKATTNQIREYQTPYYFIKK